MKEILLRYLSKTRVINTNIEFENYGRDNKNVLKWEMAEHYRDRKKSV